MRSTRCLLALALVLALVAGCSGSEASERSPGDPVTEEEAQVLADLLHRNFEEGGADFVLSAPYAEGAELTFTGEVDFLRSIGHVQAVTRYEDGRPNDVRTLFFTANDIWFGDVPGLAEALAAAGAPPAAYMHRPLIKGASASGTASLIDVMVQLVLNLSSRSADDPRAFLQGGYTWEGQRSIDGRLTSVYRLKGGQTVAVSAGDKELVQYVAPLEAQGFDVTITLTSHGEREIQLPTAEETVDAAEYPQVAQQVGV